MFARVATFEGGNAAEIGGTIEQMRAGGRPDGVPATEFLLLVDRGSGKTLGITLFETEDDLRQGSAALEGMSPPTGALGRRTSVETFEVPLQLS
jgi:hypothetical protein